MAQELYMKVGCPHCGNSLPDHKDLEGHRVFSGYAMLGTTYPLYHARCIKERVVEAAQLQDRLNSFIM